MRSTPTAPACAALLLAVAQCFCPTGASADDEVPPSYQPPPPRGTHARFTASGHVGPMWPVRYGEPGATFVGAGFELGFDTMFHPHHEVGFRASDTFEIAPEGFGYDVGHWVAFATDYRVHPELVVGALVPYMELAGGLGLYFGCLVGDACGGLGVHGEAGAGVEIALDPFLSLHAGVQLRFLAGFLGNGVDATIQPSLGLGIHAG